MILLTNLQLFLQKLRQQVDDEERSHSEIESYLRTHHDVSKFLNVINLIFIKLLTVEFSAITK